MSSLINLSPVLFFLICWCSFNLLFRPCLSACNSADKQVLLQIKQALNNPYHLASWNPDTDCCDWYDVECDPDTSRIITLNIFSANISGQIPPQVGSLPYLQTLIFHKITNITGTIPSTLSKLKRLEMLRLNNLNLSGTIPDFFSELRNLTFLDLSFNQLTGSLPTSVNKLSNLLALHFDRNQLTGTIPDTYGKFVGSVPEIYLSHNQLSGEIPDSMRLLNFTKIDVSRNQLEGDASLLLGQSNKALFYLDISRNAFSFDLGKVEFPGGLGYLDVNHNKIYGNIPAAITSLDLQFLNASYNRLCGQIPVGGKLQSFDYSSYIHNKCLCGSPLPECM
uniref:Leucine-rich repeat-containing N-terminal plant-type domain-containing protein n=1 Tax=Kalanchoe fedtschenkoi TaxID=63787 RepID=A0A7N0UWX1_KALFE